MLKADLPQGFEQRTKRQGRGCRVANSSGFSSFCRDTDKDAAFAEFIKWARRELVQVDL